MSRPTDQLTGWWGLGFAAAAVVATSLAAIAIAASGHGALDRQAVGGHSGDAAAARSRSQLANRCFALVSVANERFVAIRGDGYRADERRGQRAAAFFLEPTGIGTFLLQDQGERLLAVGGVGAIERSERPGERAEWRIRRSSTRSFELTFTVDGRRLAAEPEDGERTPMRRPRRAHEAARSSPDETHGAWFPRRRSAPP